MQMADWILQQELMRAAQARAFEASQRALEAERAGRVVAAADARIEEEGYRIQGTVLGRSLCRACRDRILYGSWIGDCLC